MARAGEVPAPTAAVRGWLVACSVYLMAVLHRTSLGVAGLLALQRFHIGAAELSVFVLVQLGLYSALQIPAGLLVDRFGPRRLLVVAAAAMVVAQAGFALAPSYPAALLARAVLGVGDALTFVSVLRFVATNLPGRRFPVFVALTTGAGFAGNMIATFPLAVALVDVGWTTSFLGLAGLSVVAGALVVVWLPGAPPRRFVGGRFALAAARRRVARTMRVVWAMPLTRLGFWSHFTGGAASTALAVLWGQPYLVTAVGLTPTAAGAVLLVTVLVSFGGGLALGAVLTRHLVVRVPLAVTVGVVTVVGWGVLLALPSPPVPLAVAVVLVTALGSPTSTIAFGLARDYNEQTSVGTATGIVNGAGFLGAVVIALGIGLVLTALGGTTAPNLRWAMLVLVGVEVFGLLQLVRWWRRARAFVLVRQARGDPLPVVLRHRRWLDFPRV